MKKPKFCIGNIVIYKNDFSYNIASKVISIGRIEGIHIHEGKGIFETDKIGKIQYTISASGVLIDEEDLINEKGITYD